MKLAIIGPAFFGYLDELAHGFARAGTPAQFFDERPSNTLRSKLFYRFASQSVKQKAAQAHIDTLTDQIISQEFTHVLLISVEVISNDAVQRLKAAELIICRYGWDSVHNKPHMHSLDPLMDRIASFDATDCTHYGYDYIPLYSNLTPAAQDAPSGTDFFYCTTLHSNRPFWVKRFLTQAQKHGWSTDFKLFYHNRLLWMIRYISHPQVWGLARQLSTVPFSRDTIVQATQKARVVLDIHHGAQTGLTMRTYETLALGKVLLTTNKMAATVLPADLRTRVVYMDADDLGGSFQKALDITPAPLTPDQAYSLSQNRFIDQLTALLSNTSVPAAHVQD